MRESKRLGVGLLACVLCAASATAQQAPRVGTPGKDAMYVPTPPELVAKMMDLANVGASDYVIDLGSGDGRLVIAAAQRGARAMGVEFNPELVDLSRRNAANARVSDRARFVAGDMYDADISLATVMALYLLPNNLTRLTPKFLTLRPGSRIVTNTFQPEGWQPDARTGSAPNCSSSCEALLWIVPARVAGSWRGTQGVLTLTQSFQFVTGTMIANGSTATIVNGKLRGADLTFVAGGLSYSARVEGDAMQLTTTTPNGPQAWTAARQH